MTKRNLFGVGLGALLALGASGCDPADITDVNENPNNPTTAPSPALFTAAVRNGVARWLGTSDVRGFELVAQHLAEVQYPETDQYRRLDAASTAGIFNGAYNTEIEDFHQIVRGGEVGYAGPARVMRAWSFFNLTDVWGDIPYSQALQGDSTGGTLSPAYDAQKDIYTSLFGELNRATTDMAASASGLRFGSADPLYAGSLPAWQRFANSLRARHALRLVNVDRATADAQLRAAFSAPGGVFTSNAHNAQFNWPGDGVYDNPWASNFKTRDDHRISNRFMTIMRDRQDPRVSVFAQRAERDTTTAVVTKYCDTGATTCYVGLANALTHAEASKYVPYTSRPGAVFYPGATAYGTYGGSGASFPSFLMTYAEVAFIQAEAAERSLGGLAPAQARGFYEAGVRASMTQWGLSAAQADAYLLRPEVMYVPGSTGLSQIATEKWVALYAQGAQAWAEFRRTCQPALLEPGPNAIVGEIPRRYTYSTTEYAVNDVAVQAAIAQQGADNLLTRMYWDKNPTAAPTYVAGCGVR